MGWDRLKLVEEWDSFRSIGGIAFDREKKMTRIKMD
jgi:hypothetical protein